MQKRIFDWCRVLLVTILLSLTAAVKAQTSQITVSGVVTSQSDGEPMIGVTVKVQGSDVGTITDTDGKYSIQVKQGQSLAFSFIGYESQVQKVTTSKLNIALREDTESLDEVVVVGYGVQKKKLLTGATVQVKGDDIQKLNTNNPLQAMQGQTPGMSIVSNSGQPGESMNVKIRGLGTIGSASPLYIIDGVGGDIATLNPADIESIDVLKDAASAAIYGASAANGVVLVTTKSGREGKTSINFDGYWGWQNVGRKAQMLNAKEYMTIMDEQQINSGNLPYNWGKMQSIRNAEGQLYDTDWLDQMFKDNAQTRNYSISITGGNAISNFAISAAYTDQEGIVGGKDVSNYERYNFRVNSDHKIIKNLLKIGEQISYVTTEKVGIGVGNQYNNSLRGAFGVSPLTPVYSENGRYGIPYNATDESDWNQYDGNPYGLMMINTNNESQNKTLNANFYAELTPVKGLRLRSVFGMVYGTSEYRSFTPLYHFSPYSYNDTRTSASQNMSHGLGMTWTNTAQYDMQVGEHAITALLGMESYRYKGTSVGGSNAELKEGFDDWEHAYVSNGTASTSSDGLSAFGNPHDDSRSVSYFGRLGWNYQEKYMVNATLRCDGSSHFAKGNRFGWFPSVSAGWTLTEEDFMEDTSDWMNFLKLRASWGQVGNQNISNYQYLAPIKNTNTHYLFGTSGYDNETSSANLATYWGAYPSRVANPDVKWETSTQTNLGIDARFLDNRLSFVFDWYKKTSKDWLVVAPVLATVGTGAPYINGGDVTNSGIEAAFTWSDNIGKDFHYTVGINGAYNKNEVGEIPTSDGIIHGNTNMLYDNSPEFYRAQDGHAIGYFWGYKTAGLFQNQDDINQWISNGNGVLQSDVKPGDVKYYDVNHDGAIDDNDKVDLGNGMPDFTYGFNINLDWKGFDFALQASGAAGMQIVQSYRNHANAQSNYTTEILKRWTGEGTSNRIPRVTTTNINWQFSDLYVHDADYLRMSTITLGYNLSRLWKNKVCSQCRIYVQGQNLLTFTKYNGMDPEIGTFGGGSDWAAGVDVGYYPRPRTVMIGCNIKF